MVYRAVVVLVTLFVALSPVSFAGSGPGQAGTGAIQLFNGKDLTNFYTWLVDSHYQDPDRVFSVVEQIDGAPAIRVSGQHFGAFITREEYSNYRLVVEFRWGLPTWGARKNGARDSGVLLHCQGPDGNTGKDFNGPWMRSVEFQIIQGGVGDIIIVAGFDRDGNQLFPRITSTARTDPNGQDYYDPSAPPREFSKGRVNWGGKDPGYKSTLGGRGRNDVESPEGQWTRLEAICEGDQISNVVNGKVVNVATRCSLTRGKIIFQSEGSEIFYRKIELTPLGQ